MTDESLLLSVGGRRAERNAALPVRVWGSGGRVARAELGGAVAFIEGTVFRLAQGEPNFGALAKELVAERVLQRWLERGNSALPELVGDFVLVLQTAHEVLCFKPLTSPFQLFYTQRSTDEGPSSARWVSTRLAPLVARLPGTVQPDPTYLMRLLMVTPGLQHALPYTPFEQVRRLRPWHLLRFLGDEVVETQLVRRDYRYGRAGARSLDDYGEELCRVLRQSVHDRVETAPATQVCCEISGGLDSSFIACLVGEIVERPKGYMFSCPEKPSHRYGEGAAQAVADRYGFDFEIVDPREWATPDLSAVLSERDAAWEEPTDFFWYGPLFGPFTAGRLLPGSRVFTGYAGDALFMRSPLILPHLMRHGHARSFANQLLQFSQLTQRSAVSIAAQSALALLPRPTYLGLTRPFLGRRFNPFSVLDITADWQLREPITWLMRPRRDLIAQQEAFDEEGRHADEALIGSTLVRDDSISYLAHRRVVISPWLDPKQIDEHSPFCDQRLFDFTYGEVPWEHIHGFEGPYKNLLRSAQKAVVPAAVRERKEDVFVFDTFRAKVVNGNATFLRDLLRQATSLVPGLFDEPGLAHAFEELSFGKHSNSIRSLYVLFGYLAWLAGFRRRIEALRLHARLPGS